MTHNKEKMQDNLVSAMDAQTRRPVMLGRSDYEFIKSFIAPRYEMPDHVICSRPKAPEVA